MIRNINNHNDLEKLAPCVSNRENIFAAPLSKKKSKRQALHWKKCFILEIELETRTQSVKKTPFFRILVLSTKTQLHFSTFLYTLKKCWVTYYIACSHFTTFCLHTLKKCWQTNHILKRKQMYSYHQARWYLQTALAYY